MNKIYWLKSLRAVVFSLFLFLPTAPNFAEDSDLQEIKPFLPNARQVGQGPFTYLGFKVYDAKYFVNDDQGKTGFAIRLDYTRKILGTELSRATIRQFERLGAPEKDIAHWEQELNKLYPNVDNGHHITAIYQPNDTTIFFHNGKQIGKIINEKFSKYFFSIWLDPKTNRPELRLQLLGELCTPHMISPNCLK
jgi:hypothetical protein